MRKTILALAALAALSSPVLAKDTSAVLLSDAGRPAASKEDLDHSATNSIERHGPLRKLFPHAMTTGQDAPSPRQSGIWINPFFPNPH